MPGSNDVLAGLKSWLALLLADGASQHGQHEKRQMEIETLSAAINEIEQLRAHRLGQKLDEPGSDNDLWPESDA